MKQVVLVTGALGHLGRAVVQAFHAENCSVIACDTKARVERYYAEETQNPSLLECIGLDLLREQEVDSLMKNMVKKYKRIHVGALLAGGFAIGEFEKVSFKDIDEMFSLNFKTSFYIARLLYTHMKAHKGGRILLVGARSGLKPSSAPYAFPYALSKAALVSLAKVMDTEGSPYGVYTRLVAPSVLDTPPNREAMPDADYSSWVKPQEVAKTLCLLASSTANTWRQTVLKLYHNA